MRFPRRIKDPENAHSFSSYISTAAKREYLNKWKTLEKLFNSHQPSGTLQPSSGGRQKKISSQSFVIQFSLDSPSMKGKQLINMFYLAGDIRHKRRNQWVLSGTGNCIKTFLPPFFFTRTKTWIDFLSDEIFSFFSLLAEIYVKKNPFAESDEGEKLETFRNLCELCSLECVVVKGMKSFTFCCKQETL